MNRSEILGQVYDAILQRPANAGTRWFLCWQDGKIQCLPIGHVSKPEIIFEKHTTHELEKGFETLHWEKLEAKIYTFLKDKGLCKKP